MRRLVIAVMLLAVLAGCKPGDRTLAADRARAELTARVFAAPGAVQTMTFTSGATTATVPYALDGVLFAKRWLSCKTTAQGAFSAVSTCVFDQDGRTFASQNGWSSQPGSCAACQIWTVPVARARLASVDGVTATDATHAVVAYTYTVEPNVFGASLGRWMTTNPVAWCGPDPRLAGGWSTPRSATASFVRDGGTWAPASPPGTFEATFASGQATGSGRPCPTAPAS